MPYGFKTRALTFLDSLLLPPDFNTSITRKPEDKRLSGINIYPNPFDQFATVSFEIPTTGNIEIKVFNQMGQVVSTLVEGQCRQGKHHVYYEASGLPTGIYFLRLQAGQEIVARKIIRL